MFKLPVNLHQQLRELEDKRQNLKDEMQNDSKGTPMEERERLLKQVISVLQSVLFIFIEDYARIDGR